MTHLEIDSFVVKFKNLCSAGYKATLTIDAEDGKASVCLKANLGDVSPPFLFPQPYRPLHHVYRGPSYHRRQERRKAAKSAAVPAAPSDNIIDAAEQVDTSNQAEQTQIISTVVSVQDKEETQEAEEAIKDSEIDELAE